MKIQCIVLAVLIATIAGPTNAFAFMDVPTLVVALPSMLVLIIPIILVETYTFSRAIQGSRKAIAASSASAGIITVVGMFIIGRLHLASVRTLQGYTDILPYGVSSIEFMDPSITDILYNCTIGSAFLVQRTGYFLINIIIIGAFLLPTILIYNFSSVHFLRRRVHDLPHATLRRLVVRAKLFEYVILVLTSLVFARWYR